MAIAFFYATGTAVGGITGPFLFGKMIESGEESQVAIAFFLGAAVMAIGGIVELFFGVKAAQQSLEDIAEPLTAQDAEGDGEGDGKRTAGEIATRRPRRPARSLAGATSASGGGVTAWDRDGPPPTPPPWSSPVRSPKSTSSARFRPSSARFWGPGRFPAALREAVESGRARRVSRNRFGPVG